MITKTLKERDNGKYMHNYWHRYEQVHKIRKTKKFSYLLKQWQTNSTQHEAKLIQWC